MKRSPGCRRTGGLLAVLLATSAVAQPERPLAELEHRWAARQAPLAAERVVRQREAERDLARAERGWRLFAGTRLGYTTEPLAGADVRDYAGWSAEAGIRHPLLGARREAAERGVATDLALARAREERREARLAQLGRLRRDYVELWYLEARIRLEDAHRQPAAAIRAWLQARRRAGEILASQADPALQALAASERWLALADGERRRLRQRLAGVAGDRAWRTVQPALDRRAPAPARVDLGALAATRRAQARIDSLQTLERPAWHDTVSADVRISGRLFQESDRSDFGQELAVTFSVEAPLAADAALDALRRRHAARNRAARTDLQETRQRARRRLDDAWFRLQTAGLRVSDAADGVHGAATALHEQRLRAGRLGDGAAAAWLEARVGYLQAARTALAAERDQLLAAVDYLEAAAAGPAPAGAATARSGQPLSVTPLRQSPPWQDTGDARAPAPRGTYLWDSTALFDAGQRGRLIRALKGAGLRRVLVGLGPDQLERPPAELSAGMMALRDAGLEPWLLLGEPTWIEPEGRRRLLALLRQLRGLPVAGLHLDIEPAQLTGPVTAERLRQWLETLVQASATSPWPVALSLHPRWLEGAAPAGVCVACALRALEAHSVVLMLYRRHPADVIRRMQALQQRHPGLPLGLAQSIEGDLPRRATHAGRPATGLEAALRRLEAAGVTAPGGLYLQDWAAYREVAR